jgi:hypothetical protein
VALNEGRETWAQICDRCVDERQPGPHVCRNCDSASRHGAARDRLADWQIASHALARHGARCAERQSACGARGAKALFAGLVANGATRDVTFLLRNGVSFSRHLLV